MKKVRLFHLFILFCLPGLACGVFQTKDEEAPATAIAASIFSTMTAEAPPANLTEIPTLTPTETLNPTDTIVPSTTMKDTPAGTEPSLPPTDTSTPSPDVFLKTNLSLRDGPGTQFKSIGNLSAYEEVYVVSQFDNCSWIEVTDKKEIDGWISGDVSVIILHKECDDISLGIFRPSTGIIIPIEGALGVNRLTINNGTSNDAVALLSKQDDSLVVAAYIRSGDKFEITNIYDGRFQLFFTTGFEWNGENFAKRPSYQKFEDYFDFESPGNRYSIWSVTLHPVEDGTASTDTISPEQFPGLGK